MGISKFQLCPQRNVLYNDYDLRHTYGHSDNKLTLVGMIQSYRRPVYSVFTHPERPDQGGWNSEWCQVTGSVFRGRQWVRESWGRRSGHLLRRSGLLIIITSIITEYT